jgi:carbonic anhydrase
VELNVIEQVFDLTKTSIVQNAWLNKKKLAVHGLVYDVKNGILNEIGHSINNSSELPKYYLVDEI